jgi:mono/diheme cytochrome c family protein
MRQHRASRSFALVSALVVLSAPALWSVMATSVGADEPLTNPVLGQPAAIEAGHDVYRSKCLVCHGAAGARGPNLFKTKLSDEAFLNTVINGRKDTLMPAFGLRLSPDEVWEVHAFVKSTDHY